MSKTECNSYKIKAILHVLRQFSDKKTTSYPGSYIKR